MDIPPLSQLIKCDNLESCFQALYNFFFGILVALAFVYFLWGAIEYLLSGSTFTSKDSGKKKMINSIIALIVTLLIPVIVYWINPEVFREHRLDVYEYQGDRYSVDDSTGNPTGIGSECQAGPGSGLIYLRNLGLSKIRDVTGGACVNNEIVDKLIALNNELENNLHFEIYITHGYNGSISGYDDCHEAGKALDIVIGKTIDERKNVPNWNKLIETIKRIANYDPNLYIIVEAKCDYLCEDPMVTCEDFRQGVYTRKCTERRYGEEITWYQTRYTVGSEATGGRHLHVCFDKRTYYR